MFIPGFAASYTTERDANFSMNKLFDEDRLDYCLLNISNSPDPGFNKGTIDCQHYWHLFALLEDHIATCSRSVLKKDTFRMDDVIGPLVSDFSAVLRVLTMVQLHTPALKSDFEKIKTSGQGKGWRYANATFLNHAPGRNLRFQQSYWVVFDDMVNEEHPITRWRIQEQLAGVLQKISQMPTAKWFSSKQSQTGCRD